MSSAGRSRWEDDNQLEDAARRKKEKDEKKKARERKRAESQVQNPTDAAAESLAANDEAERPAKRFKSSVPAAVSSNQTPSEFKVLTIPTKRFSGCRSVEEYERLNDIEEGSYGFVLRGQNKANGAVVALKKLKMDHTNDGFPVTGLREIQTLMAARHEHIVRLQEVVVGSTLKDIYLVMDFVEHDLKTLLDSMPEPFLPSETKTLMHQLSSAIAHLHAHWILHRDLKTSNILLNNRGEIKLADFGMARYIASPAPPLTQLVVTLWYRSPELLLGTTTYDSAIDMWSLGCVFAELLTNTPVFQGKNEVDQLSRILSILGNPTPKSWPGFRSLPNAKALHPLLSTAKAPTKASLSYTSLTAAGHSLLRSLLTLNPSSRPSAQEVLSDPYFAEDPRPKHKALFPTFPSKAGQERRRRRETPNAPVRGEEGGLGAEDFARGLLGAGAMDGEEGGVKGGGFALRMG